MRTFAAVALAILLGLHSEQLSGIDKIDNDVQRFQLAGFLEDGIPLKKIQTKCFGGTLHYCVKGTMICIVALDKYEKEIHCKEVDDGTK